jgi:hypothetical protein
MGSNPLQPEMMISVHMYFLFDSTYIQLDTFQYIEKIILYYQLNCFMFSHPCGAKLGHCAGEASEKGCDPAAATMIIAPEKGPFMFIVCGSGLDTGVGLATGKATGIAAGLGFGEALDSINKRQKALIK